jgi:hypothetical protein
MRHADIQSVFGTAVEPAAMPSNCLHHHHEHFLPVKVNLLEDTEATTTSWEALWIDVGGEG